MIQLREYQQNVIKWIREALKKGEKHILVQLPTGGGKTVIFSYISQNSANKGNKVLILTDREELLKQAGGSIERFGIVASYIKAGSKFIDQRFNVYVAMSQTLRNRIDKPEWIDFITNDISTVIIDEAHIQEFNYLFESGLLEGKVVLGFTATPVRSGKMRQLGFDYSKMVRGAEVKDLIDMGYLVNCDLYEFTSPSLSGVGINSRTGDYNTDAMFKQFDNATLYQGLVKNYKKYTDGKKMIVFCCNVQHAIKTTKELVKAGYTAKFVASEKTKPKEDDKHPEIYAQKLKYYETWQESYHEYSGTRKQIFDGFARNEFQILVNVDIATKGYDCPDIEVVAVYRATASLGLWLQMIGRGSRISEGKTHFTVFDFGENKQRLGGYDDNREWSLWHETRKDGNGVPPLKECGVNSKGTNIPGAGNVVKGCTRLIMASQNICPFCGFKYPEKDPAKEVELMLSEIKDENGVSLNAKNFKQMTFEELEKYRELKKHKAAWLWIQLYHRGGISEVERFADAKRWNPTIKNKAINYVKNIFG